MRNFFIITLLTLFPFICSAKGLTQERKDTLSSIAAADTLRLWDLDDNNSCALVKMPKEEVNFYLKEVLANYKATYKIVENMPKRKEAMWYMHHVVGNIIKRVVFFNVDCDKKLMKEYYDFWNKLMVSM